MFFPKYVLNSYTIFSYVYKVDVVYSSWPLHGTQRRAKLNAAEYVT